jgi:hypothetical protein
VIRTSNEDDGDRRRSVLLSDRAGLPIGANRLTDESEQGRTGRVPVGTNDENGSDQVGRGANRSMTFPSGSVICA